jgi:predicted unusual protein kinase regulating ubiquinone biosynthesis (AarF/ABC1/UbiB family)
LIRTDDGRLAILDFGLMENVSEADREGMLRSIINSTNRDYSDIISNFSDFGFLPKYIDKQKYQPNFAAAFDTVLTRSAKDVAFSDVTRGRIEATLDMSFGLPEYFTLILRMDGTLEGIAIQADDQWIFVDAAFPLMAKKLIMDDYAKDIHQEMIVGEDGKLSLSSISLLLESFDSFS